MESAARFQILDKDVFISLCTSTLEKCMNPSPTSAQL